jgi:hypothetical protein
MATASGFVSASPLRPSHLPFARRFRFREAASLATVVAFSNCATAPSTCRTRIAVGVSSVKNVGADAAMRVTPFVLSMS